ncbi:G-type lectin S-receptor-like serine/threonine-protein kinase [Hibiscus syriacus]|uniref:G-type lectin S-receptor-like serine/threonine-protein kinase n=1 Tax=Hibiscus syriacus TaxID=106335 RepID=A0A6A2XQA7_HIBSY|nr:putative cysteine-rich receptor-like protein kinase 23 [Hibiscus syriacus]KAE8678701.1 G-type lectin S-receptor-like serine/threonine-protein kinase [Hibiscus syriacus]
MASKTIFFFLLLLFISFKQSLGSKTWIKAGYWVPSGTLPISDIKSALFTHLFCGFAYVNSTSYQLFINASNQQPVSDFTNTVKLKNPSVTTLLSIWVGRTESTTFSLMINQTSHRKSFIESSIKIARLYGFHGLDLYGVNKPINGTNMSSLGALLDEWRAEVVAESRNSGKTQLLLTMSAYGLPIVNSVSYHIDSAIRNLDWVNIVAYDYYVPTVERFTGFHAALYDPSGRANSDAVIGEWLKRGFPAEKLLLGLPYHGFGWVLVNSGDNGVGSAASGPANTIDGSMAYWFIKASIRNNGYGVEPVYNSTYGVNICKMRSIWISFDDVEAIKAKVSYAKVKGLLGYYAFQLSSDDNWLLSEAAYGIGTSSQQKKHQLSVIVPVTVAVIFLLMMAIICYLQKKIFKSQGLLSVAKMSVSWIRTKISAETKHGNSDPSLEILTFSTIKAATKNFSNENKLGEGGYGPVYKGKLPKGQEIAVKRLSKSSSQGFEEFKNEVTLTARLQHVNLVRVLGICTEKEEKMLVYEFMPNKSLDLYLYDPLRRHLLDWRRRVSIIEGVTQGLLYLQEYSNYTIIHRDIKASNILLDDEMNPKISDFGMAKFFKKEELEANTGRIVGTYGCVPPEYVRKGIYSTKYDVYSFGVLLLQIISGKRNSNLYGCHENLHLLEFAYELWKQGRGTEFFDASLDDSSSSCKLITCMQVALLCVQENAADRPSMVEVSAILKNERSVAISTPKKPAYSVIRDEDRKSIGTERKNVFSVNDASITQVAPR